jgi:hypothetical protein
MKIRVVVWDLRMEDTPFIETIIETNTRTKGDNPRKGFVEIIEEMVEAYPNHKDYRIDIMKVW